MALSQKLQMRQGQSLVMTPQLQQAIKLLQMSNFELQAYVESELESNPLLERDERDEAGRDIVSDNDGETGRDEAVASAELKDTAEQIASGENTPENLDQFDCCAFVNIIAERNILHISGYYRFCSGYMRYKL